MQTQTTPLRPLELPPFSLQPLLVNAFRPSAPGPFSKATSPPSSPQTASLGRFGQLVSNVTSGSTAVPPLDPAKLPSVRSVEASGHTVWLTASDGRVRRYEVDEEAHAQLERSRSPVGLPGSRSGSPWSAGRHTPTSPQLDATSSLELVDEAIVTQTRKAADRVGLMERLDKAVILSEGILTFHVLPTLAALPVAAFPAMRGVTTFALDESELAGGGSPDAMHVCAIKRRTLHLLKVTREGVTHVKELALEGGGLLAAFRKSHACIATAENYSIIDFKAAVAIPLLPISQAPIEDSARPLSTSSTVSNHSPPGGIDPRQRPGIACVDSNEFLIASHTGSTTLGVFVTESGEPCRGTLEWGSNLRSLIVTEPYVAALLFNDTIEIHSLVTQEIVQVIQLPKGSPSSPFTLQPRSLVRSWSGLDLGASSGANKVDLVSVPLLPDSRGEPPRTPTKRTSSLGGASAMTSKNESTLARTLLVGKNSVHALAPLTLVVQADALMDKGRMEDALNLAKQMESASPNPKVDPELSYVYLRAAYTTLGETLFQDAFRHFLASGCDPRLVVRMFPDLREPLLRPGEYVMVPKGLRMEMTDVKTIDDIIMANLNHNYSPHIKPDVETASPTIELRAALGATARDALRGYLVQWRVARRSAGAADGAGDSRKVDIVVDTTLAKLLAEEGRADDLIKLMAGPNDCVVQQVEPDLLDAGLYHLLASILLDRGEIRKSLDIFTKLVEGVYVDQRYTGGAQKVFDLLSTSEDQDLVEKYGVWLVGQDRTLGLKLLIDTKQSMHFDTRSLFASIKGVDVEAADLYLESAVLQRRDADAGLYGDLIRRYLARLGELLGLPEIKAHVSKLETQYVATIRLSPAPPSSFLSFLIAQYDDNSSQANFDRVRLKTIVFLSKSASYDTAATKKELDEMELRGLKGLSLERAIVYGKLGLDRQALSLLLHSVHDLTSAECYCHQTGDPILPSDLIASASLLSLPMPKSPRKNAAKRDNDEGRQAGLARLLVEMCLSWQNGSGTDREAETKVESHGHLQIARILEAQAMRLDPLEVLPLLPEDWSVAILSSFLKRSLRSSQHVYHEASLLKALAVSQNLLVSDRLNDMQAKLPPTLEKVGGDSGDGAGEVAKRKVITLVPKEGKEKAVDVDTVDLDLR